MPSPAPVACPACSDVAAPAVCIGTATSFDAPYLPGAIEDEEPEHYVPGAQPTDEEAPSTSLPVENEPAESAYPASVGGRPARRPIVAGLEHKVAVVHGGIPLTAESFGMTGSRAAAVDRRIVSSPVADVWLVNATMDHTVFWDTYEGAGPKGQTSIANATDPAITAHNFRQVAADLTPNESGRPPRRRFWSQPMVMRHELFHVGRHIRYYREARDDGLAWLNQRTASSEAMVLRLFERMLGKIELSTHQKTQGTEEGQPAQEEADAYEDGRSAYEALAAEILRKGRAGAYPS